MSKVLKSIIIVIATIVVMGLFCYSAFVNDDGSVKDYRAHNCKVESSQEYENVIDDVMREVYTTFAKEHIEDAEMWLNEMDENIDSKYYQEEKQKLEEAKRLLSSDPEKAAELFMMIGSCHELWYLQKTILKEKYGITWYTPAEVYPETDFD